MAFLACVEYLRGPVATIHHGRSSGELPRVPRFACTSIEIFRCVARSLLPSARNTHLAAQRPPSLPRRVVKVGRKHLRRRIRVPSLLGTRSTMPPSSRATDAALAVPQRTSSTQRCATSPQAAAPSSPQAPSTSTARSPTAETTQERPLPADRASRRVSSERLPDEEAAAWSMGSGNHHSIRNWVLRLFASNGRCAWFRSVQSLEHGEFSLNRCQ